MSPSLDPKRFWIRKICWSKIIFVTHEILSSKDLWEKKLDVMTFRFQRISVPEKFGVCKILDLKVFDQNEISLYIGYIVKFCLEKSHPGKHHRLKMAPKTYL